MTKKVLGVIPARYKSSRFPGKPLIKLDGIPMIIHVCRIVEKALGKENTYVATDNLVILNVVEKYGYNAVMTDKNCLTGTDRLWDFAQKKEADIYINIQGDEPLLNYEDIRKIAEYKQMNMEYVINGMSDLTEMEDPHNINIPKVLVNKENDLIYMSRLPIPGIKDKGFPVYKKQVCIYGFSYNDLRLFGNQQDKSEFEKFEDIEILRFFDLNIPIKMVDTSGSSLAIDVPEDVEKVINELRKRQEMNS
ncbi:MAG: 3-deoxy-manno-octulosonate cytidylyltransferase [Flavobacteriales bacterium]